MKSLEELLTILLDLSSVRGQQRLSRLLKLDSDSHSFHHGHSEQTALYVLVYWSPGPACMSSKLGVRFEQHHQSA